MAKQAKPSKSAEVEVTPRIVNKVINDILAEYANLESARGSFMNKARRIRESIQAVIDGATARGLPPKIVKLQIRIEQTEAKLKAMMAELDSEERKLLKRVVVAHGSKSQLRLFDDLPEAVKPEPVLIETAAKPRKKHPEATAATNGGDDKKLKGASGADIDAAIKASEVSDAVH